MAKYSHELFDEIIAEMMREKKTLMEMMAELDCDDTAIYASQTRIAKKQQTQNMIEAKSKPKEPKPKVEAAPETKPEGKAPAKKGK